tara:strand:- start:7661 stop:8089 length:429 start_codon:yes stop_codon:yes gene_type:complete
MKSLRPHLGVQMQDFLDRHNHIFSAGKDAPDEVWTNDLYQVFVYKGDKVPHGMGHLEITWLSIKRNDRNPIHDWRDLQSIKNQVTNREFDAIEIYPRESRLVDEANQFHLWVFTGGDFLPIGFKSRSVLKSDDKMMEGAKQR